MNVEEKRKLTVNILISYDATDTVRGSLGNWPKVERTPRNCELLSTKGKADLRVGATRD
jgi:hypothetical protein